MTTHNKLDLVPKSQEQKQACKTITQMAARLEMWATGVRQDYPGADWAHFDKFIDELKSAVPGQGPVKNERRFNRGYCILQVVAENLANDDYRVELANTLEVALEEIDAGIQL